MFVQRDILRFPGKPKRDFRIVWSDAEQLMLFDLISEKTRFETHDRKKVEKEVSDGRIELLMAGHDYNFNPVDQSLSKKQRARRNQTISLIRPLLAQVPYIFDDKVRGKAVAVSTAE